LINSDSDRKKKLALNEKISKLKEENETLSLAVDNYYKESRKLNKLNKKKSDKE